MSLAKELPASTGNKDVARTMEIQSVILRVRGRDTRVLRTCKLKSINPFLFDLPLQNLYISCP